MTDILTKGRELYQALAGGDLTTLRRLLADDFQGDLTQGLPHGLGRHYDGLDAMMSDGWAGVGEWFDMSPHPEELIDGGHVLVGRGHYVGTARHTGRPVRAAFAHFWPFDGRQFTGVVQVTDSAAWRDGLAET